MLELLPLAWYYHVEIIGDPDRIRTCDHRLRRPVDNQYDQRKFQEVTCICGRNRRGNLERQTRRIGKLRIWFDTEFIEDGKTIELLSIGMVREDGATYYAESAQADHSRADDWVKANVLVNLTGETKPRAQIAKDIVAFAGKSPEFWAYYADYDWVVLCQLYGRMIDLPKGFPMFCMDIKQRAMDKGNPQLPKQTGTAHNALADAWWNKDAWEFLAS